MGNAAWKLDVREKKKDQLGYHHQSMMMLSDILNAPFTCKTIG